jgi:enterochelin esterase family protein
MNNTETHDTSQWDQDGIEYRTWKNVPEKDIECYEYAAKKEPDFPLPDEAELQSGTPAGTLTKHTWTSSRNYPGVSGDYWVYVPQQYAGQEMSMMLFLDGELYIETAKVPTVLDNLIARGEIPLMLAVFVNPGNPGPGLPRYGGHGNRSIEYDSIDNRYANFLIEELIPVIKQEYNVSGSAHNYGICGISSSGNAAFAAAWNRNDIFNRVISHLGSFTNIRGGNNFPSLIRSHPKKNIKVFLQTGEHDLNICFGNWKIANEDMASALEYKDYEHKIVIGPGGHSLRYGASILPDTLRWLWKE